MKRKRIIMILLCVLFVTNCKITIYAKEINKSSNDIVYSNLNYNTEDDKTGQRPYDIINLSVSQQKIDIESNGCSKFIDVVGTLQDGQQVYLSEFAEYVSYNDGVAFADSGRIIALSKGKAIITVTYGNFSEKIYVNVLNQVDLRAIKNSFSSGILAFTSPEREAIDARADAMVYLKWTPSQNLRGWRNGKTFYAGTSYYGIPYSQTDYQVGKDAFLTAMNSTNMGFYNNYSAFLNNEWIIMPKYGNDCSGFVSFSWDISRQTTTSFVFGIINGTYTKVGSYDAYGPSYSDLITSYQSLQRGDAVVKMGHTFLITANWNEFNKVYVYEQTPYAAIFTSWTYDQMASAGYMPFTE